MISLCTTSIYPNSNALVYNTQEWLQNKLGPVFTALDKKSEKPNLVPKDTLISVYREPKFNFEAVCPHGTYSRKNIAFLGAIKAQSSFIFETDDDNKIYNKFLKKKN